MSGEIANLVGWFRATFAQKEMMEMIGQKIKELRVLKGLTQEDLAEKTNLSVRTIQRIESGDVDPRTYTLNLLAEALDVELELFTAEKVIAQKENLVEKDDTKLLGLLHLSGLFIMIFPPLVIWIWKKDELKGYEQHFKDVMNFQLSIVIYLVGAVITAILIIPALLLPVIGIASTIIILINSIKVLSSQPYRYPFCIQFMK